MRLIEFDGGHAVVAINPVNLLYVEPNRDGCTLIFVGGAKVELTEPYAAVVEAIDAAVHHQKTDC